MQDDRSQCPSPESHSPESLLPKSPPPNPLSPKSPSPDAPSAEPLSAEPPSVELYKQLQGSKHVKAVVKWGGHKQAWVFCSLHWNRPTVTKAFFSLSIKLPTTSHRKQKTPIYLFIHPERVEQLTVLDHGTVFGQETRSLKFQLSQQSALVLPKDWHPPTHNNTKDRWEDFYDLAVQLQFTIDLKLSHREVSDKDLKNVCEAISGSKVATLRGLADIRSLYSGSGARVEEGERISGVGIEALPSYELSKYFQQSEN